MKELERRINETFAKGLEYMEVEQAFFDAHAKWIDAGDRRVEARTEVNTLCADIAIEAADGEEIANRLASAKSKASVADSVFGVATREYEVARANLNALPQDVLQAKAKLAKARYRIAMAKYLQYDRDICIAQTLMLIADDDETTRKLNDAYTLKNAAALEMEKAKTRCKMLEIFGRG